MKYNDRILEKEMTNCIAKVPKLLSQFNYQIDLNIYQLYISLISNFNTCNKGKFEHIL